MRNTTQAPSTSFDFAHERLPALFGTLALSTALLTGGCERKSAYERVMALPVTTPTEIVQNPDQLEGKRVRIEIAPVFKSDDSKFQWHGGEPRYLDLEIRYELRDEDGNAIECIIDDFIPMYGGIRTDANEPASTFYLRDDTIIVAGTLKRYVNSRELYLDNEMSIYHAKD